MALKSTMSWSGHINVDGLFSYSKTKDVIAGQYVSIEHKTDWSGTSDNTIEQNPNFSIMTKPVSEYVWPCSSTALFTNSWKEAEDSEVRKVLDDISASPLPYKKYTTHQDIDYNERQYSRILDFSGRVKDKIINEDTSWKWWSPFFLQALDDKFSLYCIFSRLRDVWSTKMIRLSGTNKTVSYSKPNKISYVFIKGNGIFINGVEVEDGEVFEIVSAKIIIKSSVPDTFVTIRELISTNHK